MSPFLLELALVPADDSDSDLTDQAAWYRIGTDLALLSPPAATLDSVLAGEIHSFDFEFVAPAVEGEYTLWLQLNDPNDSAALHAIRLATSLSWDEELGAHHTGLNYTVVGPETLTTDSVTVTTNTATMEASMASSPSESLLYALLVSIIINSTYNYVESLLN